MVSKQWLGEIFNESNLREFLVRMGFTKSRQLGEAGEYTCGGIIDIFPPRYSNPVRLDLFGTILDGACPFRSRNSTDN